MSSALLPCPFCEGEARVMLEEEDSPDDCFHNIYCTVCGAQFWVKSKTEAIAVWNRRAQPENNPLTLDKLREMDGEPVWIVTLDGTDEPRWEIIVSAGKYGIDLICVLNGVETRDYADFDLYNDTWLAYRSKPKEE